MNCSHKYIDRRQTGFSIVEYMIAMVIGLIIIGAVSAIYMSAWTTGRARTDAGDLQEQGRDILNQIGQQVRQAGAPTVNPYLAGSIYPLGSPAIGGTAGALNTSTNKYAADSLTIAYVATPAATQDCLNQTNASNATTGAYATVSSTYSLANSTLQCLGSGNATAQPISSSVEDFQIRFGIINPAANNPNDVGQYVRANALTTPTSWNDVRTVSICFVLVGANQSTTTSAQIYKDCQGGTTTAPDNRLRMVFRETFALRNLIIQTL